MAWQPIETAPRDGRKLCVRHADGSVEEGVCWMDDRSWAGLGSGGLAREPLPGGWVSTAQGKMPIDPPVEWDAPSSPTELTPAERREIAEAMGLTVKIQFEPCPFGGSDEWCVIWRDGEWYAFAPDENPAQAFEVAREHGICVWFRDGAWHAAPAEEAFFSDLLEHWASAETAPLALCRCALALIRSAALTPPAPPEDKGP